MRTGRRCDWCDEDAVFSFMVPEPAGAVVPEWHTTVDFCHIAGHISDAVHHLARITNDRVYPAGISFSVVDV